VVIHCAQRTRGCRAANELFSFLFFLKKSSLAPQLRSTMNAQKRIGDYVYSERDFLGKGAYGSVYRGYHVSTNEAVAVKIIDATRLQPRERKYLEQEIQVHASLQDKNIIKLYAQYVRLTLGPNSFLLFPILAISSSRYYFKFNP